MALQDIWPDGTCFGCGPANEKGLQLKSHWAPDGDYIVAEFHPKPEHNAGVPNVMYGGLVACVIDCHSVWASIAATYKAEDRPLGDEPRIWYVTGTLTVKYIKPTPINQPLQLKAWVDGAIGKKNRVVCELSADDIVTATGDGIIIRVSLDQAHGNHA